MKLVAVLCTIGIAATVNLYPATAKTAQAAAPPAMTDEQEQAIAAKDMFKRQLETPAEAMNTGIQYWIEVKQKGRTLRANNRFAFHSGDQVRFHVTPNIDGYAYIIMRSGSKGQKEVLFPDKDNEGQNQISRGQELVIPPDGAFEFDSNPGVEKLALYISRKPIDPSVYTQEAKDSNKPVAVAMNFGAKDLIPSGVFIAYMPDEDATPRHLPAAKSESPASAAKGQSAVHLVKDKTNRPATNKQAAKQQTASKPLKIKPTTNKPVASNAVESKPHATEAANKSEASLVTVVSKETDGVLSTDIALHHL